MKHDVILPQQVMETDRFTLRPMRRSDLGLIDMYASDIRVAQQTTSIPHPLPPGTTEAFIGRSLSDDRCEDVWVIDGILSKGPEVMGLIRLEKMDREQGEVSYWVAPAFWNTGLASHAVKTLVEANPMNNKTLFASVFQDNPASARVLTNCGFQYLGDAESFSVARDAAVPTWTYSRKLD